MSNIKIDDFLKFKSISNLKISPDSTKICFMVHEADYDENSYILNLWVYDLVKQKYYLLKYAENSINFIWLKDSKNIVFTRLEQSKDNKSSRNSTAFFKLNIQENSLEKLFIIPKIISNFYEVYNDALIFTSSTEAYSDTEAYLDKVNNQNEYSIVLEEVPFSQNGSGYINKVRNKLYVYYINENKIESLTDDYENVEAIAVNESKCKAAFTSVSYLNKKPLKNSIYIYDLITKTTSKINNEEKALYSNLQFLKDDILIFSKNDMSKYGLSQDKKFYLFHEKEKSIRCLTPNTNYSLTNAIVTDSRIIYLCKTSKCYKDFFYFVDIDETESCLYRLDSNGNIDKVISYRGTIDDFDIKNNIIIFTGLKDFKLQELYCIKDNKIVQLTEFNEKFYLEKKFSNIKKISVNINSKISIDGWIMSPSTLEKNKKYPAVLNIHSGPKAIYNECFYHEMQLLSSHGFIVIFCNPRGSDGKGNDFADIRGNCGYAEYEDLIKFTDEAIKQNEFIDENNIGIMGASYGGYLTNWIIGHTNKFKAAISISGISNWTTMCLSSDIGYFFADDMLKENLFDNPELYWELSPLKYADNVKTPTLFIHADEDYRCGVVESLQMFSALKVYNVDSKLCIMKNSNHSINSSGKPRQRKIKLEEIVNWFEKYLINKRRD